MTRKITLRTREQWAELVREYFAAGVEGRKEFRARHHLTKATIYRWKHRFEGPLPAPRPTAPPLTVLLRRLRAALIDYEKTVRKDERSRVAGRRRASPIRARTSPVRGTRSELSTTVIATSSG